MTIICTYIHTYIYSWRAPRLVSTRNICIQHLCVQPGNPRDAALPPQRNHQNPQKHGNLWFWGGDCNMVHVLSRHIFTSNLYPTESRCEPHMSDHPSFKDSAVATLRELELRKTLKFQSTDVDQGTHNTHPEVLWGLWGMSQRFCPISSELSDLRILHEFPIDKSKNIVTSEVHVFFQGFGRCRYSYIAGIYSRWLGLWTL